VHAALARGALLALGWWAVAEGDSAGVGFGALVVVAATAVSLALSAPLRARVLPFGVIRLAALFLFGSLRGGIDVARRAFAPRMDLAPTVMRYRTSLPSESSRHIFTTMLSLMPGTQSIAADGSDLFVHVLVRNDRAVETALSALEGHVAAAFTDVH